ncbi:MAG: MarR family transcriptional regulator [Microbacteriaceae bacterium]
MDEMQPERTSGYWYPDPTSPTSVDVLNLLRRYRSAEADMRARTRGSMGMGETDLIALRYLLRARKEGALVLQRDLARVLDISSPSVTALVDRLVKSGHVTRETHPTDRRAVVVVATADSDREVRATLAAMHQRMIATVDEMGPTELEAVARFLSGMIHAVHETQDLDEELREAVADSDAARPNSRRRGPQSPAVADETSGQADDAS